MRQTKHTYLIKSCPRLKYALTEKHGRLYENKLKRIGTLKALQYVIIEFNTQYI